MRVGHCERAGTQYPRFGPDKTGPVRTGPVRIGPVRIGPVRIGPVGQDQGSFA
jgi:hypothetical protein